MLEYQTKDHWANDVGCHRCQTKIEVNINCIKKVQLVWTLYSQVNGDIYAHTVLEEMWECIHVISNTGTYNAAMLFFKLYLKIHVYITCWHEVIVLLHKWNTFNCNYLSVEPHHKKGNTWLETIIRVHYLLSDVYVM